MPARLTTYPVSLACRLPLDDASVALHMMPCPPRGRRLARALAELRERGIDWVVSLLPAYEADLLGVADEAAACAKAGLRFENFPIEDFGVPADARAFIALADRIDDASSAGRPVAVHCRAGIGRTGVLVGSVLVRRGHSPVQVMMHLTEVRGVSSPEAPGQREWLSRLRPRSPS